MCLASIEEDLALVSLLRFPHPFSQAVCQAREAGGRGAFEPAIHGQQNKPSGENFSMNFNISSGFIN
jgi:hypothetical protein